jgi:hypothetical protein
MHELNQTAQVRYRTDALIADAAAARLAHQHRDNRGHGGLRPLVADRRHEPARARRVVGRLLIGLGTVIAGGRAEAGAGRAT